MGTIVLHLGLLEGRFAVARLDPSDPVPPWAGDVTLSSVTRTASELSVICPSRAVPPGVRHEDGYRAFAVRGPLDFDLTGILDAIAGPLARAGVPILAIGTFDTDIVLVHEDHLQRARAALADAGHTLHDA